MTAYIDRDICDQLTASELASLYNFCEWDEIKNKPVTEDLMAILAPDAIITSNAITNTMDSNANMNDIKMETMDFTSSPSSLSNEYVAYSVIPKSIFHNDINEFMNENMYENMDTMYMSPQFSTNNNTEYLPYSVIQNSISEYDIIEPIDEDTNDAISSEDNVEYETLITHKNVARRYAMFKNKLKYEFSKTFPSKLPLKSVLASVNKRTRNKFTATEFNFLLQRLLDERKIFIENGYISLYF